MFYFACKDRVSQKGRLLGGGIYGLNYGNFKQDDAVEKTG